METPNNNFNFQIEFDTYIADKGKHYKGKPGALMAFIQDFEGNSIGNIQGLLGIVLGGIEDLSGYKDKFKEKLRNFLVFLNSIPNEIVNPESTQALIEVNNKVAELEQDIDSINDAEVIDKAIEEIRNKFKTIKFIQGT